MATQINDKVKMSLTPIASAIPNGEEHDDFRVVVRMEAPTVVKKHIPIDLVAVLDVSGSMGWAAAPPAEKPSRLDLLKRAMKFVIGQLHDDDRLAIVAFNTKVVTEHSTHILDMSDKRMHAVKKVAELVAEGDTAFKPALEHAVKILDGRTDKDRLGFIILLTDGLDNSKTKWNEDHILSTDPVRDHLRKYPIHTFGFCAAHDPKALLFIAQQSRGGTYSFVDDDNLARITDAFAVCLGGIKNVFAFDVELTFCPYDSYADVKSIDCGGYERFRTIVPYSGGKSKGVIMVGTLYAGEVKNFIVHMHLNRNPSSTTAYSAGVSYKDTPGGGVVSAEGPGSWQSIARPGAVDAGQKVPPLPVLEQIVRYKVQDMVANLQLTEFKDLKNIAGIKKEKVDDIKEAMDAQASAASSLLRRWEELKGPWMEDKKRGLDLHVLEEEIREMARGLKRGAGVAYIYSWLSSHQMQRATTMGSPHKVVTLTTQFLTPAMGTMMEESESYQSAEDLESAEAAVFRHATTTDTEHRSPPLPQPVISGGSCKCAAAAGEVDVHFSCCRTEQRLLKREAPFVFEPDSWMEQRLEAWAKVKREVPLALQPTEDHQLAAVREASLEAITRAMHQDIYLAVVHGASNNLRRRSSGAGEHQQPAAVVTHGDGSTTTEQHAHQQVADHSSATATPES